MTTQMQTRQVALDKPLTKEEYETLINGLNREDEGQAYNPLKLVATIQKDRFWVKQAGAEEPVAKYEEMDIHALNAKIVRVLYLSRDQKAPTCSSADGGINGSLNVEYTDQVPEGVGDLCSTCPFNQWGTDVDPETQAPRDGKRCKERRNILVLNEDFNRPLVLSLAPSSIGKWDGYADGLASLRPPSNYIEHLTHVSIENMTKGTNNFGVIKFTSGGKLEQSEVLAALPLRKQFADWLGRVQVETRDVLGETTPEGSNGQTDKDIPGFD